MHDFPWTIIVTLTALVLYFAMGLRVGLARLKYNVPAPATTGNETFERHFRVHMNTLEWLPIFLPSLWLFASFWGDIIAAGIGAVWIAGRALYMITYVRDPATRSAGFGLQALSSFVLLIGAFVGAVQVLLAGA